MDIKARTIYRPNMPLRLRNNLRQARCQGPGSFFGCVLSVLAGVLATELPKEVVTELEIELISGGIGACAFMRDATLDSIRYKPYLPRD